MIAITSATIAMILALRASLRATAICSSTGGVYGPGKASSLAAS